MRLIDSNGRVLNKINIIDLVVLVLVFGLVAVPIALSTGVSQAPQANQQIVVETDWVPKYVAEEIETGSVSSAEVVSVDGTTEVESKENSVRLQITTTVKVDQSADGLPQYRDERLYVGRTIQIDLGRTIIEGTVVRMAPLSEEG
jgi:hypothetical protein